MANTDLKGAPFNLDDQGVAWVERTKLSMSLDEKLGQLFFLLGFTTKKKELAEVVRTIRPGGMMYRTSKARKVAGAHRVLQQESSVPMLLAANLEAGGNGLIDEGTFFGNQMLVAASDDEEQAYRLGLVSATEAKSVGGNLCFAPILDINYNFRNPITNTRSFGDDPDRVARMGAAYMKGAQAAGAAVTIKHFPGDGTDGRDQHLVTTYNSLSVDDWMNSFGMAYRTSIDAGARGLMVGHIGFPAWVEKAGGNEADQALPATLNPALLQGLLREELGYKGVTITDASLMTGFGQHGRREDLVPRAVAAGCDMFLFSRDPKEDFSFMRKGYEKGIITDERLDEAVTRILGLKASLGLHTKTRAELVPDTFDRIDLAKHRAWAKELADKAITLVKDDTRVLPLTPAKTKKIGVVFNGNEAGMAAIFKNVPGLKGALIRGAMAIAGLFGKKNLPEHEKFIERLKAKGFDAFFYDFGDIFTLMKDMNKPLSDWTKQFDAIVIFAKWETMSNQTSLQVQYKAMGFDAPWFVKEVPTILVSVANPYHGYDLPMIPTVINGYAPSEEVYDAIVDKMTGNSAFTGVSPVDLDFKEFTGRL